MNGAGISTALPAQAPGPFSSYNEVYPRSDVHGSGSGSRRPTSISLLGIPRLADLLEEPEDNGIFDNTCEVFRLGGSSGNDTAQRPRPVTVAIERPHLISIDSQTEVPGRHGLPAAVSMPSSAPSGRAASGKADDLIRGPGIRVQGPRAVRMMQIGSAVVSLMSSLSCSAAVGSAVTESMTSKKVAKGVLVWMIVSASGTVMFALAAYSVYRARRQTRLERLENGLASAIAAQDQTEQTPAFGHGNDGAANTNLSVLEHKHDAADEHWNKFIRDTDRLRGYVETLEQQVKRLNDQLDAEKAGKKDDIQYAHALTTTSFDGDYPTADVGGHGPTDTAPAGVSRRSNSTTAGANRNFSMPANVAPVIVMNTGSHKDDGIDGFGHHNAAVASAESVGQYVDGCIAPCEDSRAAAIRRNDIKGKGKMTLGSGPETRSPSARHLLDNSITSTVTPPSAARRQQFHHGSQGLAVSGTDGSILTQLCNAVSTPYSPLDSNTKRGESSRRNFDASRTPGTTRGVDSIPMNVITARANPVQTGNEGDEHNDESSHMPLRIPSLDIISGNFVLLSGNSHHNG